MTRTHNAPHTRRAGPILAAALLALVATSARADHHGAGDPAPKEDQALKELDAFIAEQNVDKEQRQWRTRLSKPPQASFDAKRSYYWMLDTSVGELKIELFPDIAPMHVSSTIYLTRLGFYDGLSFHRVIDGFMAQGGDPVGNGTGGPGYEYDGEFTEKMRGKHSKPGILSMANRGPGTDGSQFFLTFTATPHLDGRHTVFGAVAEGKGTLKELESHGSRSGRPSEPLQIRKASVLVE